MLFLSNIFFRKLLVLLKCYSEEFFLLKFIFGAEINGAAAEQIASFLLCERQRKDFLHPEKIRSPLFSTEFSTSPVNDQAKCSGQKILFVTEIRQQCLLLNEFTEIPMYSFIIVNTASGCSFEPVVEKNN